MTRARLMSTGENRIDYAQPAGRADALRRQAISGSHDTVMRSRTLERSHDCRANSDDASSRQANGTSRCCGNAVRFIEWQKRVEFRVSGR